MMTSSIKKINGKIRKKYKREIKERKMWVMCQRVMPRASGLNHKTKMTRHSSFVLISQKLSGSTNSLL